MALIRRRRSFQFFYFLLFKDSREEAKEYDENAIGVYKLKGVPEDGIDIPVEEIKEKSSVEILEGEQVSEAKLDQRSLTAKETMVLRRTTTLKRTKLPKIYTKIRMTWGTRRKF